MTGVSSIIASLGSALVKTVPKTNSIGKRTLSKAVKAVTAGTKSLVPQVPEQVKKSNPFSNILQGMAGVFMPAMVPVVDPLVDNTVPALKKGANMAADAAADAIEWTAKKISNMIWAAVKPFIIPAVVLVGGWIAYKNLKK